eukprot:426281-Pyramimonas_sp.AAC.1
MSMARRRAVYLAREVVRRLARVIPARAPGATAALEVGDRAYHGGVHTPATRTLHVTLLATFCWSALVAYSRMYTGIVEDERKLHEVPYVTTEELRLALSRMGQIRAHRPSPPPYPYLFGGKQVVVIR